MWWLCGAYSSPRFALDEKPADPDAIEVIDKKYYNEAVVVADALAQVYEAACKSVDLDSYALKLVAEWKARRIP